MSKHKTVEKWVAHMDEYGGSREPKVKCFPVQVIEKKGQFCLNVDFEDADFKAAYAACGYKKVVNKSSNTYLFDTKKAAMTNLVAGYQRRESMARIKHERTMLDRQKVEAVFNELYGEMKCGH